MISLDKIKVSGFGAASFVLTASIIFVLTSRCCNGLPVTSCPNYKGNFYIADHLNKCVYYWCLSGQRLGGALRCPPGTGVNNFHRSNRNPCQLSVSTCSRFGPDPGSGRSTPAPSTRMTTPLPMMPNDTTTMAADDTTEAMTTMEQADVTTTAMMDDVTTEEMTSEDPGSGDGEDLMPVDVTTGEPDDVTDDPVKGSGQPVFEVHTDMQVVGGLKISDTSTFAVCLQACSLLSGVGLCAGLEYNESMKTCHIHTMASECTQMTSTAGTVHVRLLSC